MVSDDTAIITQILSRRKNLLIFRCRYLVPDTSKRTPNSELPGGDRGPYKIQEILADLCGTLSSAPHLPPSRHVTQLAM